MINRNYILPLGLVVVLGASSCGKIPYSVNPADRVIPDSSDSFTQNEGVFALEPTVACTQDTFSFEATDATEQYQSCAGKWVCGPEARLLGVTCVEDEAARDGSYDCSCDEDGDSTTFTLSTPCAIQGDDTQSNIALLAAAVEQACGWQVADAAP